MKKLKLIYLNFHLKKEKKSKEPLITKIDFSCLDLRVGKIIKCEEHPTAKNLYVEQIDIGDSEIKNVCSGLVKHLKLEQVMFYFKNII